VSTFAGRCHCGALEVAFETARAPGAWAPRACACSFCRKHAARMVSDPAGALRVGLKDPSAASRYRFEKRSADFLVCGRCGVYVAVLIEHEGRRFGAVNALVLDDAHLVTAPDRVVDYSAETAQDKLARRLEAWTPAVY
jgi:hypothetical protein